MGIPTEFKLNGDSLYTLWNGQTAFSGQTAKPRQPILRAPEATQAIAVTWDEKAKTFTSVYFQLLQEGNEKIAADSTTGLRIAGKPLNGSDLFIISLPGKKVRPDLSDDLKAWIAPKASHIRDEDARKKARIARSSAIGALVQEVEKLIGKSETTPKPAAPVVQEPPAQPARPAERPTTILGGAAREIGEQRPAQQPVPPRAQTFVPERDFDDQDFGSETAIQVYRGEITRDFDRGFTFIRPYQNISELGRGDAFLHISVAGQDTKLKGGDQVEFELALNEERGQYQVSAVWARGSRRPDQTVNIDRRDPNDTYDHRQDFRGNVERDAQGIAIIREIPIRTPFPSEFGGVVPGGAWTKVKPPERDPA